MPNPLLQATFHVASAFQAVERLAASPLTARDVAYRELQPLKDITALRPDLERIDFILGRFDRDHPPLREARIALLRLEGLIWGEIARSDPSETEKFRPLIEGQGPIDVEGIERAHRWVRWPFIEGLQRVLGDRPFGGRAHHVVRSPLELFAPLSERLGRDVYFKREDRQPITSFKNRGATNILIHERLTGRRRQPCAASHGNHAQGLALAASNLGFPPVRLFLPVNASPLKIEQCREMGAEVVLVGQTFEEAEDIARAWQLERPDERLLVPAYENPLVAMGQGTMAVEMAIEMARLGHEQFAVLVPAGGGGMLAGIATYLAPQIPVFGVESDAHPFVSISFRRKEIVQPPAFYHIDTDADGIALQRVGQVGFPNILAHVRDMVAIPEELIRGGIAYLYDHGYTPEGASATPVAALLYGVLSAQLAPLPSGLPIVCVYSGRNIHPERLDEIVATYGRGRWADLAPKGTSGSSRIVPHVKAVLTAKGFMKDGVVLTLENARRGIELVHLVAETIDSLETDCDLIDVIECLNWGPIEHPKRINGTLRSLGMWGEREGLQSKRDALFHPYDNRATVVISLADHPDPARANEILQGEFWMVQRLLVEMVVTEFFIDEKRGWTGRIGKEGETAVDTNRHREHLRLNNDRLQGAMDKLAGRLGVTVADFETMTEDRYRGLFRSA